jgi:hypothetical protein
MIAVLEGMSLETFTEKILRLSIHLLEGGQQAAHYSVRL